MGISSRSTRTNSELYVMNHRQNDGQCTEHRLAIQPSLRDTRTSEHMCDSVHAILPQAMLSEVTVRDQRESVNRRNKTTDWQGEFPLQLAQLPHIAYRRRPVATIAARGIQ